jgi:hypothetical protein
MNRVTFQIRSSMWDRLSPAWLSRFDSVKNDRGVASVISRLAWNRAQVRFGHHNRNNVRIRQMVFGELN